MLLILGLKGLRTDVKLQFIKNGLIFPLGMEQAAFLSAVIAVVPDLYYLTLLRYGRQVQHRPAIVVLGDMPNEVVNVKPLRHNGFVTLTWAD